MMSCGEETGVRATRARGTGARVNRVDNRLRALVDKLQLEIRGRESVCPDTAAAISKLSEVMREEVSEKGDFGKNMLCKRSRSYAQMALQNKKLRKRLIYQTCCRNEADQKLKESHEGVAGRILSCSAVVTVTLSKPTSSARGLVATLEDAFGKDAGTFVSRQ